jgi:hypothetical protein
MLYAAWGAVLQHPSLGLTVPIGAAVYPGVGVLGGLVFGLAAGMARERSESIAPIIVVHWTCVALAVVALGG